MASEKVIRVTCDVCGKKEDFQGLNTWNREVWTHAVDYTNGCKYMTLRMIDICDDCLMRASRLHFNDYEMKYEIKD